MNDHRRAGSSFSRISLKERLSVSHIPFKNHNFLKILHKNRFTNHDLQKKWQKFLLFCDFFSSWGWDWGEHIPHVYLPPDLPQTVVRIESKWKSKISRGEKYRPYGMNSDGYIDGLFKWVVQYSVRKTDFLYSQSTSLSKV